MYIEKELRFPLNCKAITWNYEESIEQGEFSEVTIC